MTADIALAVHGGAGTIRKDTMRREREDAFHEGLRRAVEAGRDVLANGGAALDAVTASVMALEDDPLFNAGRGAVYNAAGAQEMDAAVMEGRERRAGAVAGIFGPRNPVLAARAVMERTPHVMLIGEGALELCRGAGLEFAPRDWFRTEQRWGALKQVLDRRRRGLPDNENDDAQRHGTVGAVARDRHGNVAAATSTGGMTGKAPGRVGDSPVIGAGTFADNATCAVSATGHGEYFIRWGIAHEVAARIRYAAQTLDAAAHAVLDELLKLGGTGGLIAVGRDGPVALPFNASGMYRGYVHGAGPVHTAIHEEEYRRS